ncbi:MAG: hypothetical protein GF411_14235 [Candidatus Lokiarchaeota archaeon]|nr:hypothetical protein [Candidatus Lokiarchaeota archaeon]
MSTDLIELFLDRMSIEAQDIDPAGTEFVYGDAECEIKSVNEDTVQLTINGSNFVSDDISELESYFDTEFDITRERNIDELARELRVAFKDG